MTASYHHLALAEVVPGMVLSDELLDVQGHVLLPQGTVLTEGMLALMPRHGIEALPIRREAPEAPPPLVDAAAVQARLDRLFRRQDLQQPENWATAALHTLVLDFRLGKEDAA